MKQNSKPKTLVMNFVKTGVIQFFDFLRSQNNLRLKELITFEDVILADISLLENYIVNQPNVDQMDDLLNKMLGNIKVIFEILQAMSPYISHGQMFTITFTFKRLIDFMFSFREDILSEQFKSITFSTNKQIKWKQNSTY